MAAPADVTLTLTDDETLPTVALALSPPSITENGGISTVTATLSGKSSEAVTVMVGAAAGTGAVGADFDLSAARTLTIAAGQTTSTGAVTVTANDNTVDAPDKTVTVSGTVTGGNGVALPTAVTLTLTNDDMAAVTLLLSDPISGQPDTIKELATAPSGRTDDHGHGAVERPIERGVNDYGVGDVGDQRGGGRLHAERGDHADHRGRRHDQQRDGDDHGGGRPD